MTFSRVRNPAGWTNNSVVQPGEFEAFDANLANAVDGAGGGTYTPTTRLTIGGQGIEDASATLHAITEVPSSGYYVIGPITSTRLVVTGGSQVTGTLWLQLADAASGAQREIFIDSLPAGVGVIVQNAGGQAIANGNFTCLESERRIHLVAECQDAAWSLVHHGADPNMFATLSAWTINTPAAPRPSPTVNMLTSRDTWFLSSGIGFFGSYIVAIASQGDTGLTRRVRIDRLLSGAQIQFTYNGNTVHTFVAGHGSAWNLEFEFQSTGGGQWKLARFTSGYKREGNRTQVINSLSNVSGGKAATIDTNRYDAVVVNEPLTAAGTLYSFTIGDPIEEHQQLELWFTSITGTQEQPDINILTSTGSVIHGWAFDKKRVPYEITVEEGPPSWLGGPASMRLKVLGGQWRYMGMTY